MAEYKTNAAICPPSQTLHSYIYCGHINGVAITYDPAKRAKTLSEQGLDFADAALVFEGPTFDRRDDRFAYPEPRYICAGLLRGRMVIIVWTPVAAGRRIISMRKANDREKARFGKQLA